MPRLGRYCQGEIAFAMNRDSEYGDALRLTLVFRISHRRGPSYLRNQQRCRFANSSLHLAGLEIRLRNQATTESLLRIPVQPKRQTSTLTLSFYRRRPRHQTAPVVCSQYQLSKLQEEENGREEVDDFQSGSPVVADPLNARCSSPLHSGYDAEKAELLRKVSRLREIAHLYNDEAEEWFSKYMKYKGHQETRITALLQRHFPLSNIAGYNLAQDKIIYVWDV